MIPTWKIYPRSQGHSTVYLKNVITDPMIEVGDYTIYDDFVNDPRDFHMKSKGITPIYLITDHINFYERYGWELKKFEWSGINDSFKKNYGRQFS